MRLLAFTVHVKHYIMWYILVAYILLNKVPDACTGQSQNHIQVLQPALTHLVWALDETICIVAETYIPAPT